MAIDTDGPAAGPGRKNGYDLDYRQHSDGTRGSDGQNETTLLFAKEAKRLGSRYLPSETIPYIVLPKLNADKHDGHTFDPLVAIGDLAVVVFKEKIAAAICAERGPWRKIGEASIRLLEMLYQPADSAHNPCPDPCEKRDPHNGFGLTARNNSVGKDVLYFVFPGSRFLPTTDNPPTLPEYVTYETIESMVTERAFNLFNQLCGSVAPRFDVAAV
jgi:Fungal chitosanase of glycosyl hydrolase group 75